MERLGTRLGWTIGIALAGPLEGRRPYSLRLLERSGRRRLRGAVEHAYGFVPHYRALFDSRGLTPADVTNAADLARLPILERAQLQADPERFVSTKLPREDLIRYRSGGSSGEPAVIYHDPHALFEGAAHRQRRRPIYMREAGRRLRLRQLSFGLGNSSGLTTSQEFWSRSLIPRGMRANTESHSMLAPPEENVRHIERFKPDLVSGYGSYLEVLMDHIADRGGASHMPALIVFGGDAMSERSRRSISGRFGIPVYGAYGSVEAFQLGFECEAHRGFHMNTDLYPTRLVDREGQDVPEGSDGEVVISNLVHRGTVVLNYRLGDVARWIPGACPCGRVLPVLSYIEGRIDDWLELPDGELLHPQALRWLLTVENEHVRSYQIEQRSPSRYVLRVVAAPGLDGDGRRELAGRLSGYVREVAGGSAEVEVDFVTELPRTARGKVRTVISPNSRRRARPVSDLEIAPSSLDELHPFNIRVLPV